MSPPRLTAPFATSHTSDLCLDDGTPISVGVGRDQATQMMELGWFNLVTGAFTVGPPPPDIRPIVSQGLRGPQGSPGVGKGLEVYNVLDYGAVRNPLPASESGVPATAYFSGNGYPAFDSSLAVADAQADARASSGGGIVYFPAGLYTAAWQADNNIIFMGDGPGASRVIIPPGGGPVNSLVSLDPTHSYVWSGGGITGLFLQGRLHGWDGNPGGGNERLIDLYSSSVTVPGQYQPSFVTNCFLFDAGTEALWANGAFTLAQMSDVSVFWAGRIGIWTVADSIKMHNVQVFGGFGWADFVLSGVGARLSKCKSSDSRAEAATASMPDGLVNAAVPTDGHHYDLIQGRTVPNPLTAQGGNGFFLTGTGLHTLDDCVSENLRGNGIMYGGLGGGRVTGHRWSTVKRLVALMPAATGNSAGKLRVQGWVSGVFGRVQECGVGLSGFVGPDNEVRVQMNPHPISINAGYFDHIGPGWPFIRSYSDAAVGAHLHRNRWLMEEHDEAAIFRGVSGSVAIDTFDGYSQTFYVTGDTVITNIDHHSDVMPGDRLRLSFVQDVVGGHSVTFDPAGFFAFPTVDVAANTATVVAFANISDTIEPAWALESVSLPFTLPTGTAPDGIPGLIQWNKADALILADDDPIANWPDSSGLGSTLSQTTPSARPIFKTGVIGGQPVARFDGLSQFMTMTAVPGVSVPVSVVVVGVWRDLTITPTAGINQFMVGGQSNSQNFGLLVAEQVSPSGQHFTLSGTTPYLNGSAAADTAAHLFVAVIDPATTNSGILYIDGHLAISGNVQGAGYGGITLGAGQRMAANAAFTFAAVDVAEVAVFDHTLTGAERQELGRHFRSKYGLPIPL